MLYRVLILEDDQNPSKVIDDFPCAMWDDIPETIIAKGYGTKNFVVYQAKETEEHSIKWLEVGYYKLPD